MSARRVLKYKVPIDDQPHIIGAGRVLMAHPKRDYPDDRVARKVEVWVEAEVILPGNDPDSFRTITPVAFTRVQVFGTGQPLPEDATWRASTVDDPLVWHVYQIDDRG